MPEAATMKAKGAGKSRDPQGVTPGMVLDAAEKILAKEGHTALTMRRIAGDLGVAPPTVYWHVGNKEELLSQLMDRLEQSVQEVKPSGETPGDRIKSVVRGIHEQFRRSPALHALSEVIGRAPTLYSESQHVFVTEFQKAGLSAQKIGFALHNLLTFSASYFYIEALFLKDGSRTRHFAGPDAVAKDLDEQTAAAITADADIDAIFEFQLDQLVDSLLVLGE